jgi:chromosome segregation ATPase
MNEAKQDLLVVKDMVEEEKAALFKEIRDAVNQVEIDFQSKASDSEKLLRESQAKQDQLLDILDNKIRSLEEEKVKLDEEIQGLREKVEAALSEKAEAQEQAEAAQEERQQVLAEKAEAQELAKKAQEEKQLAKKALEEAEQLAEKALGEKAEAEKLAKKAQEEKQKAEEAMGEAEKLAEKANAADPGGGEPARFADLRGSARIVTDDNVLLTKLSETFSSLAKDIRSIRQHVEKGNHLSSHGGMSSENVVSSKAATMAAVTAKEPPTGVEQEEVSHL